MATFTMQGTRPRELSDNIIERVYDPNARYQPIHLHHVDEESVLSTHPFKSTKVWKQQKTFSYEETPRERMQEKVLKQVVPGQDGRQRVTETTEWPYSILAQITMKFKGQIFGGSGALVGPNHVITCGHNVYDTDEQAWAEEITVYPALNDKHAPFGSAQVVKVYTFTQYTNQNDECYDIALLILNIPIGKYTGWAGMLAAPDDQLSQEKVNIVGYPGDKGMTQLWGMKHTIHKISPELFEYLIDTNRGQSGSAIWISKFGTILIVGIHTTRGKFTNTGVRLSKQKFEALVTKIAENYKLEKTAKYRDPSTLLTQTIDMKSSVRKRTPLNREGRGRALIEAASLGDLNEVEQLLSLDTDVNAQNKENETPLIRACENGHEDIVTVLIENGAMLNTQRKNGDRALEIATTKGFTKIVHQLVIEGADLVREIKLIEMRPGGSVENIRKHCPALVIAADSGNSELVRFFLDRGVQINEVEEMHCYRIFETTGGKALMAACKNGHEMVVKLLLERKINVNWGRNEESDGVKYLLCHAALYAAYDNKHWQLARLLIEKGFDIDSISSKDRYSGTYITHKEHLLFRACSAGDIETITLLLTVKKVDLNRIMKSDRIGTYDRQTVSGTGWPMTVKEYQYRNTSVGADALSAAQNNEEVIQFLRLLGAVEPQVIPF